MSRTDEVMSELEAIGAVGEKVVVLKLEPNPERVMRVVSHPPELLSPSEASELSERMQRVNEVCREALQRLEVLAKEVQDLQQVFAQAVEMTQSESDLEGEYDAEVHQEA